MLQRSPGDATAMHFLGVVLHQSGQSEQAVALVEASVTAAPGESAWHNTLGNLLSELGRHEEAAAAFLRAVEADAHSAVAWNNLGASLLKRGLAQDAIVAFDSAVTLEPRFEDALHNLGAAHDLLGDAYAAARSRCAAYVANVTPEKPHHMLGLAYSALGKLDEAAAVYRQWLSADPGNAVAMHLLAGCTGSAPGRASDAYLESYFDGFSGTFEEKLVQQLDYRVPETIGSMLQALALPLEGLDILDAGCGTGLCGPWLAPFARRLVGVDISGKSLVVAHAKRLYHELHKQELVGFLETSAPAAFDLIAAADTLIYFGDIAPFLHGAARVLAPGGRVCLSFEEQVPGTTPFTLAPSGRYQHSRAYLLEQFEAGGWSRPDIVEVTIRTELGRPVAGLILTAGRKR